MKFKHLFAAYIAVWLCLILATPQPMYASNPTVTVTKTASLQTFRASIYSISFTNGVALTNTDTAFIYNETGNWFAIDGVGAHPSDSLITLECYSSETTADSIRFAIVYQVSSAASPTLTAGTMPNSGWVTALVDSAVMNNKLPGVNPSISRFAKLHWAGQATKMRILIYETPQAITQNKDATQTLTLRLVIPRR